MRHRFHGSDLLQNANLVGRSPALDDLRIRVELGNLHATNLNLFPGCRNAVEWTALRSSDRVGKRDVVLVHYKVLHGDLKVGKR